MVASASPYYRCHAYRLGVRKGEVSRVMRMMGVSRETVGYWLQTGFLPIKDRRIVLPPEVEAAWPEPARNTSPSPGATPDTDLATQSPDIASDTELVSEASRARPMPQ